MRLELFVKFDIAFWFAGSTSTSRRRIQKNNEQTRGKLGWLG